MKKVLLATIVCWAALSYGQYGATSTSAAPNNASLTPSRAIDTPPFDQSPKDALTRDAQLAGKLQKLLPQGPGIQEACDGFKKLGDCVTTIHVSQNLGIPLSDLKGKVTGKGAENLEKAIHELKPDVDAKVEKKKAFKQADKEIPVSN